LFWGTGRTSVHAHVHGQHRETNYVLMSVRWGS